MCLDPQRRCRSILRPRQIVLRQHPHPEFHRRAEIARQPQRRVGSDRRLLARQPFNPRARRNLRTALFL